MYYMFVMYICTMHNEENLRFMHWQSGYIEHPLIFVWLSLLHVKPSLVLSCTIVCLPYAAVVFWKYLAEYSCLQNSSKPKNSEQNFLGVHMLLKHTYTGVCMRAYACVCVHWTHGTRYIYIIIHRSISEKFCCSTH